MAMCKLYVLGSLLFISLVSYAQSPQGDWNGAVNFQGKEIAFAFHITGINNSLQTTMDIPSQGLMEGKAATTDFQNDSIIVSFPNFGIIYKALLANDTFTGQLIQNNFPIKLDLTRGKLLLERPQEPKPPFNYTSHPVSFISDGNKIVGTLTIPENSNNPPVAILISGSGPQNRDGDMFGHSLYYVIADHLSRNGIAVLRYDERGVGESTGDFAAAGIKEFSQDAFAAFSYLKDRQDFKESKIGYIGHSIGGIIAPQLSARYKDIDFTVMLAGPGVDGDQLMLSQKAAMERLMGIPEAQIAQGQEIMSLAYGIIKNSKEDNNSLKERVTAALIERLGPLTPTAQVEAITNQITTPEIISLLQSRPASYLKDINNPLLALNGTLDFQVPYQENLDAIRNQLQNTTNKRVEIRALDGLNHLFQESTTGALSEYSEIEQTIAPSVLEIITQWIKSNTQD